MAMTKATIRVRKQFAQQMAFELTSIGDVCITSYPHGEDYLFIVTTTLEDKALRNQILLIGYAVGRIDAGITSAIIE